MEDGAVKKTKAPTGPYAAFLKACKGWRDPNPFDSSHPEVGRNLCMGCVVSRAGSKYSLKIYPHRQDETCERYRSENAA